MTRGPIFYTRATGAVPYRPGEGAPGHARPVVDEAKARPADPHR